MLARTPTRPRMSIDRAAVPAAVFVVVLIVGGSLSASTFLTAFNVGNVLIQVTPLLLVAIGQTAVIASAGIDLSIGSIVSLASVMAASLFGPVGVAATVMVVILVCGAVGVVNGGLVSRGLDPFLATLATLSIVQGLAFVILDVPGGYVPEEYNALAGYLVGPIPVALVIVGVFVPVSIVLLNGTKTGLEVLSTGSNATVARLCGVSTSRARVAAYVFSGICAGLAGLFLDARTLAGDPLSGANLTLDSIAAVVLGGTALTGGRATIVGTCLGALALALLSNFMNFAQVSTYYQVAVKGTLVIAAVILPYAVSSAVGRLRTVAETRSILAPSTGDRGE